MKDQEFVLLFRMAVTSQQPQPSPDQLQAGMKQWQDWMGGIAAQNKLVSTGNRLAAEGKVVKPNHLVTDGPYAEIKEALGGYIIVKAKDLDEAVNLTQGCPIFHAGGNVEVRKAISMDSNN